MAEGNSRNFDGWLSMSNEDGLSKFLRSDTVLRNTQTIQHELSSRVTFRTSSSSTFNQAFNFGRSKSESESLEIDEEISQVETIEQQVMKKHVINTSATHSPLRHCDSCTCKPRPETQQQKQQQQSTATDLRRQMFSSIIRECNHNMTKNECKNSKKEVEEIEEEEKIENFVPSYSSTPITEEQEISVGEFDTTFIAEITPRHDEAKKCLNSEFASCLTNNETPTLIYQSCRSRVDAGSINETILHLHSPGKVTKNQQNEEEKEDLVQKQISTMITPKGTKNDSNRSRIRISVSAPRSSCHPPSKTLNSHSTSVQRPPSNNDNGTQNIAPSSTGPQIQFELKGSVQWSY